MLWNAKQAGAVKQYFRKHVLFQIKSLNNAIIFKFLRSFPHH